MRVGVVRETAPGERRVALVPEVAGRITALGAEVAVEAGAGESAWHSDEAYAAAGVLVLPAEQLYATADVLLRVRPPDPDDEARMRKGQTVVGLLQPLAYPAGAARLAAAGVTAISLDLLPRTLSRAQSMDALSSQASVAGYKAALVAANAYDRYLPLLMTAAGTSRPAKVLVLGAGVAGLQALGTARRLGAVVTGYDVRPAARGEVESMGASFLDLELPTAEGTGGYARALEKDEQQAQQAALAQKIGDFDIVITTAQVPGRRPPLLVAEEALRNLKPGSVVVDLGAGPYGGNVAGSQPDTTVVQAGVTVIGAGNLPSEVAAAASFGYSRNISALLAHLTKEGELVIDPDDEIQAGVVVCHAGEILNPQVAAAVAELEAAR